jgi:hypothetical protein
VTAPSPDPIAAADELTPLSIPELLDRIFTLYRRHWVLFIGIMAVPAAISLLFTLPQEALAPMSKAAVAQSRSAKHLPPMLFGPMIGVGCLMLVGLVVWQVTNIMAMGAATSAVSGIYRHAVVTIPSSYSVVKRYFWRLIALTFLTAMMIFGAVALIAGAAFAISFGLSYAISALAFVFFLVGMLVAVAVMVWLTLRYCLSVPALIVEDLKPTEALRRSALLTREHLGRAFLIFFCGLVITYACLLLFHVPFSVAQLFAGPETGVGVGLGVAGAISGAIGTMISSPIWVIGITVLYFDARVRHEALDLQVMLSALEPPPTP